MFGTKNTQKIKVDVLSKRSTKYELQVCSALKEAAVFAGDLHDLRRGFNNRLEEMPKLSVGAPKLFYKLEQVSPESISKGFELWHLDSQGNRDRRVAVVYLEKP